MLFPSLHSGCTKRTQKLWPPATRRSASCRPVAYHMSSTKPPLNIPINSPSYTPPALLESPVITPPTLYQMVMVSCWPQRKRCLFPHLWSMKATNASLSPTFSPPWRTSVLDSGAFFAVAMTHIWPKPDQVGVHWNACLLDFEYFCMLVCWPIWIKFHVTFCGTDGSLLLELFTIWIKISYITYVLIRMKLSVEFMIMLASRLPIKTRSY